MEQFSIPPGYKLVPLNMKIGSSNSSTIVKLLGGVIFLIVLLVVFMISKVTSEQKIALRRMELQNEQQASKAQVIMDTISVEPVPMSVGKDVGKDVVNTSPAPAPAPASASASNVSTNGRCGPEFNNTICPGKQCCSGSNWCAGTQGTSSAWCYSNKKGRNGGKYDGIAN